MRVLIRTNDLTAGERVLIKRRRRNLSQAEAAQAENMSLHDWLQMENDESTGGPAIGPLAVHEQCFMLRRRAGLTAAAVAKTIGVSRYWLSRMERGTAPVDTLAAHWDIE